MAYTVVLIDDPVPHVRRITLNRPEKRNALNHALRGEIIRALQEADQDPEIRTMIVRARARASRRATTSAAATRASSCRGTRREATATGRAT
jgi:enoyl-CoA hydratase/carnithine racemase